MIYRFTVIDHRLNEAGSGTAGIRFKGSIQTADGPQLIFVDSWTSEAAAGMTHKALKLLGLDMESCTKEQWMDFVAQPTMLAGHEIDVEATENEYHGQIQIQYRFLLSGTISADKMYAMYMSLKNAKKTASPPAPRPTNPARSQSPIPPPKPLLPQKNLI